MLAPIVCTSKKLCTYYKYVLISGILDLDHGKSNNLRWRCCVFCMRAVIKILHTRDSDLLLLVRFFNLHARFKERSDNNHFAACLVKKEVTSRPQVLCVLSCMI